MACRLQQVLHRNPSHFVIHYNLIEIYNETWQYAHAQWEYDAALKANPQVYDGHQRGGRPVPVAEVCRGGQRVQGGLLRSVDRPVDLSRPLKRTETDAVIIKVGRERC